MKNLDKEKIIKMAALLGGLCALVGLLSKHFTSQNYTLADYAVENPEQAYATSLPQDAKTTTPDGAAGSSEVAGSEMADPQKSGFENTGPQKADSEATDHLGVDSGSADSSRDTENAPNHFIPQTEDANAHDLIGVWLNQGQESNRLTYATDDFYREPLGDALIYYITGSSYPSFEDDSMDASYDEGREQMDSEMLAWIETNRVINNVSSSEPKISTDDLCFLHILFCDFEGKQREGELICNQKIADDLLEIFYELYQNEYRLEQVELVDLYGADDTLSMEHNNTSCFNYRPVDQSSTLSQHSYGLAIDVNPFYNPYVTYPNGQQRISPVGSEAYADRGKDFPYKIDESDLCYKLFREHGFTWGGNWNSLKDYQHFQKKFE